ncbi:PREDICTED: pentatricopeptide repeat-containing protein At1g04840 [Tarenaya hassleriana]|uniref:pentatricopeptide repeat-containing protein At1g04840 n=1 Tax=Tarenaya hassleriana TaxID=28532 RepID=UPI00053CA24E|nr:PREDICTED: pentatricopeptide repeat-containing protein At1g04840 [Tarenaya hassleriana]
MKSLHVLFKPKHSPAKISSPATDRRIPAETHFISLIHASGDIATLRRVHAHVLRRGLLSSRIVSQLISCSSLLRSPEYSISIFRHFDDKNLFVFNALIRGLSENSRYECSVRHFILMLRLGVRPDRLTFPFVLRSNANLGFLRLGLALHGAMMKNGVDFDSFVRVSLVDMYVKIEKLGLALKVFDQSPNRIKNGNVLIWNVLINGYCQAGDLQKAVILFESMPERNLVSWRTLIKGYMGSGESVRARELFEQMPEKDVVSWTTLINGFSQNGDHDIAISMFFRMLDEDINPNEYTIAAVLSACSKAGALGSGGRIHGYLSNNGFKLDGAIGTALVDMYAKCGEVDTAGRVFGDMKHKDIRSWTAMIQGWAIHGRFEESIQCFRKMMYSGEKPDEVLFLAVLTACLNSGEVDLGLNFFHSMRLDYSIEPMMKHYLVVIDMLGRAGELNKALKFIKNMPIDPDFKIWATLYRACRAHKNVKMAEMVYQNLLELDPKHPGSCIFLCNVYAAEGKWQEVERTRTLMEKTVRETYQEGSYTELDGLVHKFSAGDYSHKLAKEIHLKLEEIVFLARQKGYSPGTGWSVHNIEEEEKESVTGSHSEKLALAFGLIRTDPGMAIRIVKNFRICGDCHSLMKYASKISQRDIIVRDARQFHRFKDGICSCRDYW